MAVVLIPKGRDDSNVEDPTAYICLLNTLGKLLEQRIKGRLERELNERYGLLKHQFALREGRSTIDEVMSVTQEAGRSEVK